jgi:hypothetical protein
METYNIISMTSNTMKKNIFSTSGMGMEQSNYSEGFTTVKRKEYKTKKPFSENLYKQEYTTRVVQVPSKQQLIISNLDDFPTMGSNLTKSQKRTIHLTNLEYVNEAVVKINDGSDYIDPRTAAFNGMADKEKIAKSLTCTKACRIVTEPFLNPKEGTKKQFGVCTRMYCSFAHSQMELQPPMCGFDETCRFLNGKRDYYTKKLIPGTQCRFRHSYETVDGWLQRSGVTRTPLPETSELSRKPPNPTPTPVNVTSMPPSLPTSMPSSLPTSMPPSLPTSMPPSLPTSMPPSLPTSMPPSLPTSMPPSLPTSMPPSLPTSMAPFRRVRKSRWDEKPTETIKVAKIIESNSDDSDSSSSDSSSSSSSSSDSSSSDSSSSSSSDDNDTYHKCSSTTRRKRTQPTRRLNVSHINKREHRKQNVIEMPTKELAAMAIKKCIESGDFNTRVVVV